MATNAKNKRYNCLTNNCVTNKLSVSSKIQNNKNKKVNSPFYIQGGLRDWYKVDTIWPNKMSSIARFRFTAGLAAEIWIIWWLVTMFGGIREIKRVQKLTAFKFCSETVMSACHRFRLKSYRWHEEYIQSKIQCTLSQNREAVNDILIT